MTSCTLGELAHLVNGELHGDPQIEVCGANTIREAAPGEITFATTAKYQDALCRSAAVAVVTDASFEPESHPYILVEDVEEAFIKIVTCFRPQPTARAAGCHPSAVIESTAEVHTSAHIGPLVYIGDHVQIGEGAVIQSGAKILEGCCVGAHTTVGPNAVLYEYSVVGERVLIHAGASIGAYGFGYDSSGGQHILSAQLGNVIIEDDVEIGANSAVDRGTYGATVIGRGSKLDNLVMVAHNCRIGRHNMLCSQVGIAGSTVTGDYVVMAGQVGVRDHVDIGDRVRIGAKAGVKNDIPAGETYLGIPATTERRQMLLWANLIKLPEARKKIRHLEQEIEKLQKIVSQAYNADRPDNVSGGDASEKEAA